MKTLDRIEAEFEELQALKAKVAAREIELIAEADRLQAAHMDGARTMAEWVARRGDMSHGRAKRLVRTAKAIPDQVMERLAAGTLSVDRAHALRKLRFATSSSTGWRVWKSPACGT